MQEETRPSDPTIMSSGRRRSDRFPVVVPVRVKWQTLGGESVAGDAEAREVNAHGGLLIMQNHPPIGSEIELTNRLTEETIRARVVAVRRTEEGKVLGVAVQLPVSSDTFWGVTFQLKKTSAQLVRLEQAIRSGGIDPRVLREFRDAVDHVRKTAWVVYEWQERQIRQRDPGTVLSLLTVERVRRATQLTNDLVGELDSGQVTATTTGIAVLAQALHRLRERLNQLHIAPEGN